METEQAHSLNRRNVAPTRPRVALFPAGDQSLRPVVWLNLVCLDAPLVALAWLGLFARTFEVRLQVGNCVALFLTAWLIYLADRVADSTALKPGFPRSLRQEFCLQHREIWLATVMLVAGFDAYVIWHTTARATFLVGAVIGGLAVIYLVINHPLGLIWRTLPAKELAIGVLFTAGTLVALMPPLPRPTPAFVACALGFAILCALNCVSIAGWERELDRAQEKVSIATRHPNLTRHTGVACVFLAILSAASASVLRAAFPVLGCITASALLLGLLNASREPAAGRFSGRGRRLVDFGFSEVSRDARTALADLVLLTPVLALVAMAL